MPEIIPYQAHEESLGDSLKVMVTPMGSSGR